MLSYGRPSVKDHRQITAWAKWVRANVEPMRALGPKIYYYLYLMCKLFFTYWSKCHCEDVA